MTLYGTYPYKYQHEMKPKKTLSVLFLQSCGLILISGVIS